MGSIFVTTDKNMAIQFMTTHKIVVIGELDREFMQYTCALPGTILVPPVDALSANIDGNMQAFFDMYIQHLSTPEAMSFMLALIKAVKCNINILLYMNNDEFSMYFKVLMDFFTNTFGVIIGTPCNEFSIDIQKDHIVNTYLYMYDMIDAKTYIETYPVNISFPEHIIMKLKNELNVELNTDINGYISYFNNLKVDMYNKKQNVSTKPIKKIFKRR